MKREPTIRPIGHGLDAIIAPTGKPRSWWEKLLGLRAQEDDDLLRPTAAKDRLDRYHDAALIRPMYRDRDLLELRDRRGEHYQAAWRAGRFPKIQQLRRPMSVPAIKTTRASSARGGGVRA